MKKLIGQLNLTPSWRTVAVVYIDFLVNGNEKQRQLATQEILHMANVADCYNKMVGKNDPNN